MAKFWLRGNSIAWESSSVFTVSLKAGENPNEKVCQVKIKDVFSYDIQLSCRLVAAGSAGRAGGLPPSCSAFALFLWIC